MVCGTTNSVDLGTRLRLGLCLMFSQTQFHSFFEEALVVLRGISTNKKNVIRSPRHQKFR